MGQFKVRVKIYGEILIQADSESEAENALWEEVDKDVYLEIGKYNIEFVDLEVRR